MNAFERLREVTAKSLSETVEALSSFNPSQKADALKGIVNQKAKWVWDPSYDEHSIEIRLRRMIVAFAIATETKVEDPKVRQQFDRVMQSWFVTCLPTISEIVQALDAAAPFFGATSTTFRQQIPLTIWLHDIDDAKTAIKEQSEENFLMNVRWDHSMYPYVNQDSINEVACRVFTPQFYTYASAVLSSDDWTPPTLSALVDTYQRRHHPEPVLTLPNWDTSY